MESKANEKHLHELAIFVHGSLTSLHALGISYNLKKKNWVGIWFHSGAMLYSLLSTHKHIQSKIK